MERPGAAGHQANEQGSRPLISVEIDLDRLAEALAAKLVPMLEAARGSDDRQLLTLEQAATQLQITDRSLRKLTSEEKAIPIIVIGKGALRIRQADLNAYVASKVEGE